MSNKTTQALLAGILVVLCIGLGVYLHDRAEQRRLQAEAAERVRQADIADREGRERVAEADYVLDADEVLDAINSLCVYDDHMGHHRSDVRKAMEKTDDAARGCKSDPPTHDALSKLVADIYKLDMDADHSDVHQRAGALRVEIDASLDRMLSSPSPSTDAKS